MNPFQYSAPLEPEDLLDRTEEARALTERALAGHNSRLVAPRRFGKTSLLRRVLHDAQEQGWVGVYVNFFGVLTADDIAERIERAYGEQLRGRLANWFAGVRRVLRPTLRAGGGPLPASAEVSVEPRAATMLERLALPRRLYDARGARVVVAFDEFQDVLAAGERTDAVIRSEIEHHGQAASYIFSGSHVGMMRELFVDKRRAFYGQAGPVALEPLGVEETAAYVADRFAATGKEVGAALDALLDVGEGHPQRTMLLAHWLWEKTPSGGRADEQSWGEAYSRVMETEVRDELRELWRALPRGQRRVLVLVAEGRLPLFGREAHEELGVPRGGGLRSTVAALADRGELIDDKRTRSGYRVIDPLLARWIREGRPSDT
jgi:hypothetical protein